MRSPSAIIGNVARITAVAITAEAFGEEIALRIVHDYSGYIVFGVGIVLMIAIGEMLLMSIFRRSASDGNTTLSPTSP